MIDRLTSRAVDCLCAFFGALGALLVIGFRVAL